MTNKRYPIFKFAAQKKIPTGEMKDVDVQFVSLVSKAANKKKFQIFKSADADNPEETEGNAGLETDETEQAVGLLQTIKKFFSGDVEKAGETVKKEEETPATFGQAIQIQEARSQMWRIFDTMETVFWQIMRSNSADKKKLLETSLTEFTNKVLENFDKLTKQPVKKGEEHDIEKAGKKISAQRLKALQEARDHIDKIIQDATNGDEGQQAATNIKKEDEIDMDAKEMQSIIKSAMDEAVKPLNDRLDKLEKGDDQGEGNGEGGQEQDVNKQDGGKGGQEEPKLEEIIKSAVEAATQPLNDRLSKIEKARGVSNSVKEGEGEGGEQQHDVNKSSDWGGLFSI